MFTTANKIKKVALVGTVVAAIAVPAALAQTDGGILTKASRQSTPSYAGMVTDGTLLTQASRTQAAQEALEATYAGMVTDGALLTAAAKKAEPLAR